MGADGEYLHVVISPVSGACSSPSLAPARAKHLRTFRTTVEHDIKGRKMRREFAESLRILNWLVLLEDNLDPRRCEPLHIEIVTPISTGQVAGSAKMATDLHQALRGVLFSYWQTRRPMTFRIDSQALGEPVDAQFIDISQICAEIGVELCQRRDFLLPEWRPVIIAEQRLLMFVPPGSIVVDDDLVDTSGKSKPYRNGQPLWSLCTLEAISILPLVLLVLQLSSKTNRSAWSILSK